MKPMLFLLLVLGLAGPGWAGDLMFPFSQKAPLPCDQWHGSEPCTPVVGGILNPGPPPINCLAQMEAAMRAMEPIQNEFIWNEAVFNEWFRLPSNNKTYFKAITLWTNAKRNCWKDTP
jgi:predicted small lipoprotein YifL